MKKITLIVSGILVALTATAASAGSIDEREARQQRAIENGRQTGDITWREGLKLRAEQRRIEQTEARFKADGHLDKGERRVLNKMLDQSADHIKDERNNGHRRPDWLPRVGK